MTVTEVKRDAHTRVCTLEELELDGSKVVTFEGRTILVLLDKGNVYALDNRCPTWDSPFIGVV